MLVMTNLSYIAEGLYVDRDISVGSIVAFVVSDSVLNLDESIRELLRRISEIKDNEDVLVGVYRLEKVLEDGEWFRTADAIVKKFGGVVIFTGIDEGFSDTGNTDEFGKEITIKEVFSRLNNDMAIEIPEEVLADFGLTSGKRFKKILNNALYILVGFIITLILLYSVSEMKERVSMSALEEVHAELEEKKKEFKGYKNRFYKFVEGIKVEDLKKANKVSYIPFIPKTVKGDISKGKVNISGDIYAEDVFYVKSLCKEIEISCSLRFKNINKGVDIYEVAINPR